MTHLHDFIGDLALILITASIATILFKWLKQPVVLGYIVAGFIAGPYITWLPTVADMDNVAVWSEIGVIFLLFALGLEFSFKKLMDVGGTASVATLINMGSMILIGYMVGQLLDWSQMDSIFLGGMLSMSSTTIIIKAFNDMGLQKQKFAGIVFGMLIVEDVAAILMMVLLSTVAVSHTIEGMALLNSLFRLVFFIFVWFIVGIYLIPSILKVFKRYLNEETLLIISIGLCLSMVLFASKVGFSAALGAFIMGSILAETVKARQIEHVVEPIKNLFGAVFFVSVGMMLDPGVIREYAGLIIVLTLVVLVGRIIFATIGVLASGQGLKVAIQAGFSLAQIGEFSFIIATLGNSLGVISNTLYPIIVAVSIITTFTTPYCIKFSIPVYNFVEKRLPSSLSGLLVGYASSGTKVVNTQNDWKKLLKSILLLVAIYTTISLAVVYFCEYLITPFITKNVPGVGGRIFAAVFALVLMAPFLRAIIMKKNHSEEFKNLWENNHFNRGPLVALIVLRIVICVVLVMLVLGPLFPTLKLWLWMIAGGVVTVVIFFQGFKIQSRRIEARFLENLHQKQRQDEKQAAIHPKVAHMLLAKDIHLEEIEVSPSSPKVGKTIRELNLRKNMGLSIVTIIRGNKKINIPDADEPIYPYDKLIVAGDDEDLQRMSRIIQDRKDSQANEEDEPQYHIHLSQYIAEPGSPMIGHSIHELRIQEKTECMIVCIERDGQTIVSIHPSFTIQEGDCLLLAGESEKLDAFEEHMQFV